MAGAAKSRRDWKNGAEEIAATAEAIRRLPLSPFRPHPPATRWVLANPIFNFKEEGIYLDF